MFYNPFLAFSLGWLLMSCDATVTVSLINSAVEANSLECRSDGIVSCRINPYTGLINWVIDGTTYVTCTSGCSVNPSITRNYSPTYDFTNGVFNLSVDSATFTDKSTTFKCDDGSSLDDITIDVVPAYSDNKKNVNKTDGGKQVQFITACVQPGVEFEWFTVKTDNSDREPYSNGQNENTDTGECSIDSDCGGVGTVNVASVVMISTVPDCVPTKERYLGVVVKYKNPDGERTYRFDEKFLFEDCKWYCGWIICCIYLGRWILLLVLIVILLCCASRKNSVQQSVLVCIGNCPILGIGCSAILLYDKLKELGCLTILLFVCWFFDIVMFVVMILTCTDIINKQCLFYAKVYVPITFVLPWTNFYCLAIKYLQILKQTDLFGCCSYLQTITLCNNKTENEPKVLCGKCKRQTKQIAKHKCARCCKYICEECTKDHMDEHEPKVFCGKCKRQTKQIEKNKCARCCKYICEECTKDHMHEHVLQDAKDNCICSPTMTNAESYCLSCKRFLCIWCITIHIHRKHRILRHTPQETPCQIVCTLCKKNAKYYNSGDKSFVCAECKPEDGLKDIIAIDDYYFHNENNVESYCLSCQQYLCTICYTKHAKHKRILEHSQPEAGETQCPLFCNLCTKNAKYYNSGDKSFVCAECKPEDGLKDIIAIDDMYFHSENNVKSYCLSCHQFVCKLCYIRHADHKGILRQHEVRLEQRYQICEEGCEDNPVECYCMINKKNMCAACLKKIRKQSEMSHKWTENRLTEHKHFCALHSVAGLPSKKKTHLKLNDAIESHANVLCLVCKEYLCKMCFQQHLDFKQLWRTQHPAEELPDKQTSRLTILLFKQENIQVGLRNNVYEQRSLNIQTTEF